MAYDDKKKAKIKVDFEAGKMTKTKLAQKWRITRATLRKFANEGGWVYGKNDQKISNKIEAGATKKLVERETLKLTDFTEKHVKNLENNEKLHQVISANLAKEMKDSGGKLSKADGDKFKSLFQAFKLSTETLDLIFKSKRLAMGLDKGLAWVEQEPGVEALFITRGEDDMFTEHPSSGFVEKTSYSRAE